MKPDVIEFLQESNAIEGVYDSKSLDDAVAAWHKTLAYRFVQPALLMKFCLPTMRKSRNPDWKELHVMYERIHPFLDGNGRTGRIFMNWTRVKRCKLPVLVIKEEERQEYYKWFAIK